jgi:hypothetical protein
MLRQEKWTFTGGTACREEFTMPREVHSADSDLAKAGLSGIRPRRNGGVLAEPRPDSEGMPGPATAQSL